MEKKPYSKSMYLIPVIILLFVLQAALEKDITQLGIMDEALALLFCPFFLVWYLKIGCRKKVTRSVMIFLLAFSIFWALGWISTFSHPYQPWSNILKDAYSQLKFYFALGLGYILCDLQKKSPLDQRKFRTILWILLNVMILVLFAMTIVDQIFHVFEGEPRWIGVWSSQLTFRSYTNLVAQCIFMAAILLRLHEYLGGMVLIPLTELMYIIYATRRVKGFFMIPVILGLYIIFLKKGKKNKVLAGLAIGCAGLGGAAMAVFQTLYYYVYLGTESARAVLAMGGPWLAVRYFPLGTGWATYGSAFSVHPYSEVYNIAGMNVVWGLSENYDMFISDTFWPMIMGQTGFIGLAAYIIVVLVLMWWIWKRRKSRIQIFITLMMLFLYLMVMSTGESSFVNPMAVCLGFWMGFVLCEAGKPIRRKKRTSHES